MGRPGPSRYCQWMSRTRARRSNPAVRRVSALWSRLGQGLGDASQRRHKATRPRQRSSPTSHPCPRRVLSEWGRVSGVGAPRDDTSPGRDPPFGRERLSGSVRRPRAVVMEAGDVTNGSVWPTGAATSHRGHSRESLGRLDGVVTGVGCVTPPPTRPGSVVSSGACGRSRAGR